MKSEKNADLTAIRGERKIKMKKYIVEAWVMNKDQSEGRKQHDMIYEEFCPEVEAENPEEALEYAIDWYADQARENGYDVKVETDEDEIRIYEDGKLTEVRYNFRIKEIWEPKDFLKFFRKKANLTQEELSKKTGISLRTIQAYESGARSLENANYKTLKTIADVIGCSPAELTITEKIEIE